ncbi:CRISPR-associated helicase/endonuclease Cas3 [Paenibacillus sp. 598K]|uniref:CRISPR-associated helicase Cas3' n=1 Tax=Paenibacillus sp. 598K TaxID=1117987 RepID=UPI000FF91A36|nr:CRISPR-associated helicase Cas3' [Paenibacillus sp. 598K]GBF73622.1 CRISPR-associated helicase/endonuclease Cas3 [Paenibacillus sp. 598K]
MAFYAHSRDDGEYQLLYDHLFNVARRSESFARAFGASELGYLAGLLHDVGKYSALFQQRVQGKNVRVDHSTAGAKWVLEKTSRQQCIGTSGAALYLARLVAMCISGHHGGLQDYGTLDEEGTFIRRVSKSDAELPAWSSAWEEIEVPVRQVPLPFVFQTQLLLQHKDVLAWKYSFLGRMLYSCLVDADSLDTRDYTCDSDRLLMQERKQPTMIELLERLNDYLRPFETQAEKTSINLQRQKIQAACRRQALSSERGLFSLSVPTGGGKTLSSMVFALEHAVKHKLRRVIYVIPFTSIIEQNAKVFAKVLGADAILEHHSNFNLEEYEENHTADEVRQLKLGTENWDAPVVVTTSVQFFESLFSNKRSACRKLHHIAGSVIVLDEAQSLPRGYVKPCLHALQELIDHYHCSVVLCTATQPSWDKLGFPAAELMDSPTPSELLDTFKRVQLTSYGSIQERIADETVVDWIVESEQVLCIVNTRKHAKLLYDRLQALSYVDQEGLYHLSGRMCAVHRQSIFKAIRQRLKASLPCRVVSTQLIEAGVDVDFPMVLRAMAGLDSIAQAAGRCNREGKRSIREVRVFYPEKHGMPEKGWMKETAAEAQHVLRYEEDAFSQQAMQNYFDRIYGLNDGTHLEKTDNRGIMTLLSDKNRNLEIPYEEISQRFEFIDGQMQSIVIPYDEKALAILKALPNSLYPAAELRKLQPYSVQVYAYELAAMRSADLLLASGGVLYLTEMAYYSKHTGLLQPEDTVEHEVLLF